MTWKRNRKKDLLDSIRTSMINVSSEETGKKMIFNLLKNHGVGTIDELSSAELEDVFGTLFQIEIDNKD